MHRAIPAWTPLAAVWLCVCAPAGAVLAEETVHQAIGDLIAAYRADCGADVGVHVIRLADGKAICGIRSDSPFLPASNQKILTSAVALKRLGADFSFLTQLALHGRDLVVIGDGDPTTGDARLAEGRKEAPHAVFDRWARRLAQTGLTKIDGDLVIRAGRFQRPHFHPDWPADQRQSWYAAPVAAVNFNDNCLDVSFVVQDKSVRPVIAPVSRIMRVTSKVRLGKKHLWHCQFDRTGTRITLTGTITRSTPDPLPVAVPNPPMLFGCVLAERLLQAGIQIKGKLAVTLDPADAAAKPEGLRVLATQATPLAAAMRRANKQSLNMMAECLLLRSAVADGTPATWPRAVKIAIEVLREHYGLAPASFRMADGSGLSRGNRATPSALTAVLRALVAEGVFVHSLAVAGVDGSLAERLTHAAARGRILGKTGSLAGASALSGYVLDRDARPALAFSILINGRTWGKRHTARGLQDEICKVLIRSLDRPTTTSAPASQPSSAPTSRPTTPPAPPRSPPPDP